MSIELEEFELWRDRGEEKPLIIRGEARVPKDAKGSVVVCHGFKGFSHFSFFPYVAEQLANAGLCAITFDFSGSGVGKDRENFTEPEAFTHNTYLQELDDLDAVVSEARVRDWIDDSYGLFGHSRGGGIAILHAARDTGVNALVTWAAISSTNRWLPETVADWRQRGYIDIPNARTGDVIPLSIELLNEVEEHGETKLNIAASAARVKAPWLIVHGSDDETVNVAEGERLASVANTGVLKVLEGVDHSFGGKHPLPDITQTLESVTSETVNFFVKHLTST
ncbi:MAG TPA: alpha/beta fold hydrolase [Gemmatimonadaceae bacterium]|nr:alpha/beta fold hydrolase [Gemmatimonadaceae bacterium]